MLPEVRPSIFWSQPLTPQGKTSLINPDIISMEIKEGFNGKPTRIRISTQENGSIELWIEQTGLSEKETLSYMTASELMELFKEVQTAGRDLFS